MGTELEKIVEQVYFLQQVADERFGGFHYGDDYVIRDFVAERQDKRKDPSPGAVMSQVFRAPYAPLTNEMQNQIFENVKRNFVAKSVQEYMDARNLSIVTMSNKRS